MNREIKVGQKFLYVKIEIDAAMNVTKTTKESLNVIGVSEYFACVDDDLFSTLAISKAFEFSHSKPEIVNISEKKSDFDIKYFGKFNIYVYSQMSEKAIENKINREFNKWLNDKMGVYGAAKNVKIKI